MNLYWLLAVAHLIQKQILPNEASKTTLYDFNYCCNEHSEFRNALQLDIVRRQLGIEVEHLPMLDIYE